MKAWLSGVVMLGVVLGGGEGISASEPGTNYSTISFSRVRALAMGAAFMAVEDDLGAISYNPGAFSLYRFPRSHRVTLFLNGIGPAVTVKDWNRLFGERSLAARDIVGAVGLLVKGVAFSAGAVDVGLLFGEQALLPAGSGQSTEVFDASWLLDNQTSWAVIRLKPADRLALGVAGGLVSTQEAGVPQRGYTISYGILLRPAQAVRIGVSYLNLSRRVETARMPLERLVNDSVNFGLSLRPTASTTLAIDVRNVGEQGDEILNQTHFGFEQTLFSQIALRGGFYDPPGKDVYVITGGIGLFANDSLFPADRRFGHPDFVFNYTFAYTARPTHADRWHLVSLIIRI